MAKVDKHEIPPIQANPTLSTPLVDYLVIYRRADGLNLLCFAFTGPHGLKEEARIAIQENRLRTMVDALCKHCQYYPKKPRAKKQAAKPI